MEKFLFSLIFIYSINPIFPTHFGDSQRFLHVHDDGSQSNRPLVIKNTDLDLAEVINQRYKRDLGSDRNESQRNISTKVLTQTKQFSPIPLCYQSSVDDENYFLCVISINSVRLAAIYGSQPWRQTWKDILTMMMMMHGAESTFSCAVGWWIKNTKKSSVWKWDEREERLWRNN